MDQAQIKWRWKQFSRDQIKSKGDGSIVIHEQSLDMLEELLARMRGEKIPILILSAYRDPMHNARVGGAPLSEHTQGRAFDLMAMDKKTRVRIHDLAHACGFTGFGFYKTFIHCDTGRKRYWGNWKEIDQ